ncbi:MAG: hypothetical protein FWE74_11175 [Oscillospiraceae bacterium]|nr:hypothetical protein [Oscillospiraceae bacterium]
MKAKEERNLRIMIAVPCYQACEPDTMKSIYDLMIPAGVETSLVFVTGYTVVQARNRIVEKSLKDNYDYTLFVDSDVVLPNNLLERLLSLGADIACGWYVKKIPGTQEKIAEIYTLRFDGQNIRNVLESEMPKEGVLEIAACGFGCALVRNTLFVKVYDGMYFEYIERKQGSGTFIMSEDIYFCGKSKAMAQAKILLDTSLRCPHIGKAAF